MAHSSALAKLGMDLDLFEPGEGTATNTGKTTHSQGATVASLPTTLRDKAGAASESAKQPVHTNSHLSSIPTAEDGRLDHFVEKDGLKFAGTHLIVDLWDASHIDDLDHVEATLRRATKEAGATLLNIDLHHFSPNNGVSGVAVLAESHISIHTWPECGYAAIDIFMCGDAKPHAAIAVLRENFGQPRIQVAEHKRGIVG